MTTTGELRAEIERTRVELRADIADLQAEMVRLHVRNIRLMAVCTAVWVGSFAVIYKFLG